DILVCRSDRLLSSTIREKLSLFTDVDIDAVIQCRDVQYLYEVPIFLEEEGLISRAKLRECLRAHIRAAILSMLEDPDVLIIASHGEMVGDANLMFHVKEVVPEHYFSDDRLERRSFESGSEDISEEAAKAARAVDINLWVPSKIIDTAVRPVAGHTDMFYVTPSQPLSNGLYVLYFYSFGSIGDPSANTAYDVVVGDAKDYPSYATRISQEQHEIRVKAEALLAAMNQVFNQEDLPALKDVYRPNGTALGGDELKTYADGMRTWRETAGKVEASKIVSEKYLDNGELGVFELETTYEKSGVQHEELRVRRFNNDFFVISLK
ncbi:MAG: hypothetical protein ABSA33_06060, partial [Candidatus Micrarchaeaceae archaeon]